MKETADPQLERDALSRLARVHGPDELHVALLALIAPADSVESYIAWASECEAAPEAALLREAVVRVTDAARLPVLEALLDRMRLCSKAQRRALLVSARRVMAAHAPLRPLDRLHWLLMRRKLGERAPTAAASQADNELSELPGPTKLRVAQVSAYLARMVPGPDPQAGLAWYGAVMTQFEAAGGVPPCAAPDGDGLARALDAVEALPLMLRPVLVRAWVEAALATSGRARLLPDAADALRLAAGLLDSPLPPELSRHYTGLDW